MWKGKLTPREKLLVREGGPIFVQSFYLRGGYSMLGDEIVLSKQACRVFEVPTKVLGEMTTWLKLSDTVTRNIERTRLSKCFFQVADTHRYFREPLSFRLGSVDHIMALKNTS